MTRPTYLLLILAALAGCGSPDTAPTAPDPAAKNRPVPPEVEHDPGTATKQYQKAKKSRQP